MWGFGWITQPTENKPIGYILSLEGADSIVTLKHLEKAYQKGLRALGPAHYGPGRYAQGTNATGGIGAQGVALLKEMERLNIILDATHLCDDSFWEAMDHFHGHVWASHHNCRALVDHNRQFSDEQLKELISRGAVIGGVLDAWMMVPNWVRRCVDAARNELSSGNCHRPHGSHLPTGGKCTSCGDWIRPRWSFWQRTKPL